MTTYSVEALNAILLPIRQVPVQPTFLTLWQLSQDLQECLGKMEHPDHTDEGHAGYIMMQAAYALYLTIHWADPSNVGNYFIVPATTITDTDQKSKEGKWQAGKDLLDNFRNM